MFDEIGFEAFWKIYPKKVAKAVARKSWERIEPDEETQKRIFSAIIANCSNEQWRKEGGKFIPHPATWLNQERWEDEMRVIFPQTGPTKMEAKEMMDAKVKELREKFNIL